VLKREEREEPAVRRSIEFAISGGILLVVLGLLFPVLRSNHIRQDIETAQAELGQLRTAILAFYQDTGQFPTRGPNGDDRSLHRLCGPGQIPAGAYYRKDLHQGWLADHLGTNAPAPEVECPYQNWAGPYWEPRPDPWGTAYIAVLYPATRDDPRDCVVISAGPNRLMDADYSSPYDVVPSGDDIVVVILDKSEADRAPVF